LRDLTGITRVGVKLPSISSREVIKALERVGFQQVSGRGKGSHTFIYRDVPPTGITVPQANPVSRGTLRAIIRQAGLTVDEFVALLNQ
jgi:predicted RNA binding protein YcfA (HicA-like mRNA interferase family)